MRRAVRRRFFESDTLDVARALIGATLVSGECSGLIVETEAYTDDEASHFVMRPNTGALMGTTHGRIYVYRIYGVHLCLNFTADARGPGAVLLRALEPVAGLAAMRLRRGSAVSDRDLARGPGRLAQALGVDLALTGEPVLDHFELRLPAAAPAVLTSPRIGVSRAQDLPWRFTLSGSRFLSRPVQGR